MKEGELSVTDVELPAASVGASSWWWNRSSLRWHLLCAFWRMEKPAVLVTLARRIGGGKISAEVQRFLLSECIYGQVSRKFPPDAAYSTRVVKAFVEAVEEEARRTVHLSSRSAREPNQGVVPQVLPELPETQASPESHIHSTESTIPEFVSGEIEHRIESGDEGREEADLGAVSEEGGEKEDEDEDEEGVSAELCDALCKALTLDSSSTIPSGWCYRTYAYSPPHKKGAEGDVVSVRLAHNMLQGSTGCHVWPASFVLCQLVLSNQWLVTRRTCLEVGSGSGLLATFLARLRPAKVVCTDGDSETLDNLAWNLTHNDIHVSTNDQHVSGTEDSEKLRQVTCGLLPWESVTRSDAEVMNPDVIFGADVVYDPTVIPTLVTLLALFLHPTRMPRASNRSPQPTLDGKGVDVCDSCVTWLLTNSSGDGKNWNLIDFQSACSNCKRRVEGVFENHEQCCIKVAFMATAVRNESTLDVFETEAHTAGLIVKDITDVCESQPKWFHGDAEMWKEQVRVHCLFSSAHTLPLGVE